ncbi:Helix-turn-helix domain-containing protein [Roseovarius pacificus]|uniref:Helix-turn-helix domain-containing protein n=1 Tax=Roseovarius pacificus TaxID=337701 RepID=A0A1M7IIA8_9RHOB|nr:helix-turn-helix domain-containing protein [Roseovarius pacificus]GGO61097.1 hypothetical protein GCM10011315_37020 [Roseovarius pacificus]SHM40323.1 Helix-turn-helix domain-containing protein [Roseovarius pacificus]
MSELLPFCKIKLQYLLEMVADHELDDNALRVALYLALAHADHETGESHPSFETIDAAIGKHAKSVKRALNKVEAAGYMTVERGTNKGKSSRYRPTEVAMQRTTDRRREGDKIVPRTENKNLEKNGWSRLRRICLMRGNPAKHAQMVGGWFSCRGGSVSSGIGIRGWKHMVWGRWSETCLYRLMVSMSVSGCLHGLPHHGTAQNGENSLS